MKLRRALATAAVTAVIGPVALLAAPAAHATGEQSATGTGPAAASPAPGADHRTTPDAPKGDGAKTSADTAATPGDAKNDTKNDTKDDAKNDKGDSGSGKKPSTAPSQPGDRTDAGPSAAPSPEYTRPTFCSGLMDEDRGKTSLRGLPSRIVAGSGWHEFTYRVTNVSKVKVMETDVSLYLGSADPKVDDVSQLSVTVEWYDPNSGKWERIEGDGARFDAEHEFATVKSLKPGEYADAKMRISIGGKAKAGSGYFFTIGHSYGEDGQCGFDEISQFDFSVLAPGSTPGKVGDATGKPGKPSTSGHGAKGSQGGDAGKNPGHKPAGQGPLSEIPVSGSLAKTGSSSDMPMIAGIGGAAVVVGAGALFVVKRRKGNASA
ncbi:LAETG motif-containing sortase-dependent surface protein [Streptomyces sp. NPDC002537]